MKWPAVVLGIAVLIAAPSVGSVGLRLGVGGEVIPLTYVDLKDYNSGSGYGFRADFVWGRFSATTIEIGNRSWNFNSPLGASWLEFRRIGLVQRFYPLFFRNPSVSPYIGLGITATNRDRFSLNIPDADFVGITLLTGCEIPLRSRQLRFDPFIRWELNHETDWTYSYVCLGGNLIWKLF